MPLQSNFGSITFLSTHDGPIKTGCSAKWQGQCRLPNRRNVRLSRLPVDMRSMPPGLRLVRHKSRNAFGDSTCSITSWPVMWSNVRPRTSSKSVPMIRIPLVSARFPASSWIAIPWQPYRLTNGSSNPPSKHPMSRIDAPERRFFLSSIVRCANPPDRRRTNSMLVSIRPHKVDRVLPCLAEAPEIRGDIANNGRADRHRQAAPMIGLRRGPSAGWRRFSGTASRSPDRGPSHALPSSCAFGS